MSGDYAVTLHKSDPTSWNWLRSVVSTLIDNSALSEPIKQTVSNHPVYFRPGELTSSDNFGFDYSNLRKRCQILEALIAGAMASWHNTPKTILRIHPDPKVTRSWSKIMLGGWSAGDAHDLSTAMSAISSHADEIRLVIVSDDLPCHEESDPFRNSLTFIEDARSLGYKGGIIGVSDDAKRRHHMEVAGCSQATEPSNVVYFARGYLHML